MVIPPAIRMRFNFVHPPLKPSAPSLGNQPADNTNMVLGVDLSDDFAHFLKMHPGLSIEEAKRKFKEQQNSKPRCAKVPICSTNTEAAERFTCLGGFLTARL